MMPPEIGVDGDSENAAGIARMVIPTPGADRAEAAGQLAQTLIVDSGLQPKRPTMAAGSSGHSMDLP